MPVRRTHALYSSVCLQSRTPLVVAKTAKLRHALRRVTSARLSCSSSPKKVTRRLCCSLINALATRRLATNFFRCHAVGCCAFPLVGNAHRAFRGGKRVHVPSCRATVKHKIEGTFTQCKFLSLQCPSVERTHCILLYVYSRGRRSSSQRPLSYVTRFGA